jgi:hypothetical protein
LRKFRDYVQTRTLFFKKFTKQNINPNLYELHVKVCKEWEKKKPSLKSVLPKNQKFIEKK